MMVQILFTCCSNSWWIPSLCSRFNLGCQWTDYLPCLKCFSKLLIKACTHFSGETVITDHVRSIVRECLQEADVQWISSQESDINGNYYGKGYEEDEQASDKQDDQVYEDKVTQPNWCHC